VAQLPRFFLFAGVLRMLANSETCTPIREIRATSFEPPGLFPFEAQAVSA
jgi:hypothetical protein